MGGGAGGSFKSRKERLGPAPSAMAAPIWPCFKSRKERLGLVEAARRLLRSRVSNPGRNVWDYEGKLWIDVLVQVSNPGRNVWDSMFALYIALSGICFKSRKERLGPASREHPGGVVPEFQIPEGTFGTHQKRDLWETLRISFQIPEGTFGTLYLRAYGATLMRFQIPEGTFGT